MILSIDAFSDLGCVREQNEDMVLVQGEMIRDDKLQLQLEPMEGFPAVVAVADGMGGHNGGEFASELVVQSLDEFAHGLNRGLSFDELKTLFNEWIGMIHAEIVSKGKEIPAFLNMGTTLVGLLVYESRIFWYNAGDSRLYRFRGGILSQVSSDHSMREMVDPTAPSNMICNSIGGGDEVFIDFTEISETVFDDDLFILCSDGLNDMLSDDRIESLLEQHADATQLVGQAKQAGGKDNVSVVLIGFKEVVKPVETITGVIEEAENGETLKETEITAKEAGGESEEAAKKPGEVKENAEGSVETPGKEDEPPQTDKFFAMRKNEKKGGFFHRKG